MKKISLGVQQLQQLKAVKRNVYENGHVITVVKPYESSIKIIWFVIASRKGLNHPKGLANIKSAVSIS